MYLHHAIITISELPLLADRLGCVNDVAVSVDFDDPGYWHIDNIGFVDAYGRFGDHRIEWISDEKNPLYVYLHNLISKQWSDFIEGKLEEECMA